MKLLTQIKTAIISAVITVVSVVSPSLITKIDNVKNVTKIADNFYIMDYTYDYDINDIVKDGYICTAEMYVKVFGDYILGTPSANFACTTFNAKTPDGDYIFGRNFDYTPSTYMILRTNPSNGYASIGLTALELVGYKNFNPDTDIEKLLSVICPYAVVDGINEKGLSIGVLEIEKDPTVQLSLKKNINTTSMVRICLDKAATVEEAVALFGQYDMIDLLTGGCTYHYQIADAYGNSAIVEYIDNEMVVIYPEHNDDNAVDFQCATNFILTPGVDDPDGMGYDRYEIAKKKLCDNHGVLTEEEGMNLLKEVSVEDEDMNGYICSTLWSSLYNNTDKTLKLCVENDFNKVYTFDVFSSLASQLK